MISCLHEADCDVATIHTFAYQTRVVNKKTFVRNNFYCFSLEPGHGCRCVYYQVSVNISLLQINNKTGRKFAKQKLNQLYKKIN